MVTAIVPVGPALVYTPLFSASSDRKLRKVQNTPNHEGKSYGRCREAIADAISGRAHELKDKLGYSENEAKPILVHAIARYLDERFSVTSRRRLGLL